MTDPNLCSLITKEYEYIYMEESPVEKKMKTKRWWVKNKKSRSQLGGVGWYGPWRQYCFFAHTGVVLNTGCLKNIQDFIEEQMELRKLKP